MTALCLFSIHNVQHKIPIIVVQVENLAVRCGNKNKTINAETVIQCSRVCQLDGVFFFEPLNPILPADDQEIT